VTCLSRVAPFADTLSNASVMLELVPFLGEGKDKRLVGEVKELRYVGSYVVEIETT